MWEFTSWQGLLPPYSSSQDRVESDRLVLEGSFTKLVCSPGLSKCTVGSMLSRDTWSGVEWSYFVLQVHMDLQGRTGRSAGEKTQKGIHALLLSPAPALIRERALVVQRVMENGTSVLLLSTLFPVVPDVHNIFELWSLARFGDKTDVVQNWLWGMASGKLQLISHHHVV